jgi:hypothetical protein
MFYTLISNWATTATTMSDWAIGLKPQAQLLQFWACEVAASLKDLDKQIGKINC